MTNQGWNSEIHLMENVDETLNVAFQRRDAYQASLDPAMAAREDSISTKIRFLNASKAAKLREIYGLLDELGAGARPFVACARGCSACCHMNVTISNLEASLIESATGRRAAVISTHKTHDIAEFSGVSCPVLRDSGCSIYADRPFACRKHVSFHTSDYWCKPERSHKKELPQIEFTGAREAYVDVIGLKSTGVLADIRDFFPTMSET